MAGVGNVRLRVIEVPEAPPDGRYDVAAWLALMRVVARLERRVAKTLSAHGLNHPQFDVLMNLALGEGITQQELAERLLVTKGNVCIVLQKMERKGWVERRADPVDRRANQLYLTPAGRRLLARVRPDHDAMLGKAMASLADDRQRALYETLVQLNAALKNADP